MPRFRKVAAILCLIGAAAWVVRTCDRATPRLRPPGPHIVHPKAKQARHVAPAFEPVWSSPHGTATIADSATAADGVLTVAGAVIRQPVADPEAPTDPKVVLPTGH